MKKTRKFIGLLLVVAVIVVCAVPAFAANYTPVDGGSCTFNKYLIMDAGDNVPNVTFSFTVAQGNARAASADTMQVLAGVGTPTVTDVTFSSSDTTATTAGTNIDVARQASDRTTGLTAATGVELESGEKYATKQATVDFSSVKFTEPGIYRYIITETPSTAHEAAGIMHDNDTDRVLDVYVTDNDGSLVVSGYVLHKNDEDVANNATKDSGDVTSTGTALKDKTDGFTNEYNSKDLVFKKEVTGNQASHDKYFEFTVTVTDLTDADTFTVSLANDNDTNTTDGNADATSGSNDATIPANQNKTNPTSVTGAALKNGVKFYLQHGQSIAIRGLAPNANYTVTENAEDYNSKPKAVTGYTDNTSGEIGTEADTKKAVMTSYQNQRDGAIPTGILTVIAPAVAVILLAGIGLTVVLVSKRRRAEDAAE